MPARPIRPSGAPIARPTSFSAPTASGRSRHLNQRSCRRRQRAGRHQGPPDGGEVGDAAAGTSQAFSYPLVDQNNNYVYYEIRFNRDQYEFVRGNDKNSLLALSRQNLMAAEMKAPIAMPISAAKPYREGAVMLKAAWKQLAAPDPRYYTVRAKVYDTSQRQPCSDDHGADRFPYRPQGRRVRPVDLVELRAGRQRSERRRQPAGRMTLTTARRPEDRRRLGEPAEKRELVPPDKRVKAQVTRLNPIPTTPAGQSTVDINAAYRKALAKTVWTNYQLVITQWPAGVPRRSSRKRPRRLLPAGRRGPFPVNNAVNTAMETFFQSQGDAEGAGGNSCMQCHYGAGVADFSWSLVLRSN